MPKVEFVSDRRSFLASSISFRSNGWCRLLICFYPLSPLALVGARLIFRKRQWWWNSPAALY